MMPSWLAVIIGAGIFGAVIGALGWFKDWLQREPSNAEASQLRKSRANDPKQAPHYRQRF